VTLDHHPYNEALQTPPPRSALQRVVDQVSPGARLTRVTRLRGGISMGMHALRYLDRSGNARGLVLRRYHPQIANRDPGGAEREFKVLLALARAGAAVPEPLWLDASGDAFGTPSLAISLMPGRGSLEIKDRRSWLKELAAGLASLHSVRVGEDATRVLPVQRVEVERQIDRGPRAKDLVRYPDCGQLWEALRRLWPRRVAVPHTVVHGDYWAGNTLWRRGRLTGIIDWEKPSLGDPGLDVGYCRMDLALFVAGDSPDVFLEEYEAAAGRLVANLAIWDLFGATRPLPDPALWLPGYHDLGRGRTDLTPTLIRSRLARWMKRAVAASLS